MLHGGGAGLDFNSASEQTRAIRYDLDDLAQRLAACAESWVPRYFPAGRIVENELRLANIHGAAPRKTGSCVIGLRGDFAACWKDFSVNESGESGGGPLSTLKHATGLEGRELLEVAAEIVGGTISAAGVHAPSGSGGSLERGKDGNAKKDYAQEISFILSRSVPAQGTLVETYLRSRCLDLPASPDLLFNDDVTNWASKTGWPALVAIVRRADGEPTGGIHRILLKRDGEGKAPVTKPKKMMGAVNGGAVRLAPMTDDGTLGVSEGIETGIAAMMLFKDVPVWACLSTSGLVNFEFPAGLCHLFIFADGGQAGHDAAQALKARAEAANIKVTVAFPASGDDFNTDLIQGVESVAGRELAPAPDPGLSPMAIAARLASLDKDSPPEEINGVIHDMVRAEMSAIAVRQGLMAIKSRTKIGLRELEKTLRLVKRETAPTLAKIEENDGPDWQGDIICHESGEPKAILQNAVTALARDASLQGVICLDLFANKIMVRRPPPWHPHDEPFNPREWGDRDEYLATCWLQRAGVHVPSVLVHEATVVAAGKHPYHPVREYLDLLEWDRTPRLDRWLVDYAGAQDTPYTRAVGSKWLISAVARVMNPGIKVDHMLILEGVQGIGKSSGLRALFDPWFTDEISELGSKDASINLVGVWLVEFAELDAMSRSEVRRVKAFLTRTTDRYRPPFGRFALDAPRQCVFAGSVNEDTYLNDPTGGRRFWPVKSKAVRVQELHAIKGQLWAEAYDRFKAGEKFYLTDADILLDAKKEQAARQQEDAWDSAINAFIADTSLMPKEDVSVAEILTGISIPRSSWDRAAHARVVSYLQRHGWARYNRSANGREAEWRYRKG